MWPWIHARKKVQNVMSYSISRKKKERKHKFVMWPIPKICKFSMSYKFPKKLPWWYKTNASCAFHQNAPGHSLEDCFSLKVEVQKLMRAGILTCKDADPIEKTNPTPNHTGASTSMMDTDQWTWSTKKHILKPWYFSLDSHLALFLPFCIFLVCDVFACLQNLFVWMLIFNEMNFLHTSEPIHSFHSKKIWFSYTKE